MWTSGLMMLQTPLSVGRFRKQHSGNLLYVSRKITFCGRKYLNVLTRDRWFNIRQQRFWNSQNILANFTDNNPIFPNLCSRLLYVREHNCRHYFIILSTFKKLPFHNLILTKRLPPKKVEGNYKKLKLKQMYKLLLGITMD